jgi:multiple sugar transport system permease protein
LLVGVPAAYALARYNFKGKEDLAFTFLSFRFAPELVVIIPLSVLYRRLGLYDTYMGIIWVYQLITLPLLIWVLRSYFEDISPDIEQAAMVDGYPWWQIFWKILLPLVRPGLAAASLLAFVFAWNNFIFPLVLGASNVQTVTVAALGYISSAQAFFNRMAAAAVVSSVPQIILALSIQRYLIRGLSFGAVKG